MRALLIDRAAQLLRERQPVTLRGLVAGTPVSTMAVYTHFDGMNGLCRPWSGWPSTPARLCDSVW